MTLYDKLKQFYDNGEGFGMSNDELMIRVISANGTRIPFALFSFNGLGNKKFLKRLIFHCG